MKILGVLGSHRPFVNVHWTLLAGLVALWEYLFFGQQCIEGPRYFAVILATSTVFMALWASHSRASPAQSWRKVMRVAGGAIYDLVLLLILLIVVAVPITLVTPTYQCYTDRAKVLEMLVYSNSLRQEVEQQAEKQRSLASSGVGLKVEKQGRITGGQVTKDGMIIAVSDDPAVVLMLTPAMDNGAISWTCVGYPAKHMPANCRDK